MTLDVNSKQHVQLMYTRNFTAQNTFSRWVLRVLVMLNVGAQGIFVIMLCLGEPALHTLPIAGGACVSLFLLMYFYSRWLFPQLRGRQIIALSMLMELSILVFLALALGLILLIRWVLR